MSSLWIWVAAFLCFLQWSSSTVIISEIMHSPRQGSDYEFIELHNTDTTPVSVASWKFSKGVTYTFPTGASIGPNGYIIVAANRAAFLNAYSTLDPSIVYGDFIGKLSKSGEKIEILDSANALVLSFSYGTNFTKIATGYGPSLEIVCDSESMSNPNAWRGSALPSNPDMMLEFSGSPGRQGTWYTCPAPAPYPDLDIKVSEVMYHPVNEITQYDIHEFIEFYNNESKAIQLDGYRIVSSKQKIDSIRFTFPTGSTVPASSYFLVVRDKSAFTNVYSPSSDVLSRTFGNYDGTLSSKDTFALVDTNGEVVLEFSYSNQFPWPIGADVNNETAVYKGLSIERVSFGISDSKSYNWVASIPTPGAKNSADRPVPHPVATDLIVFQGDNNTDLLAPSTPTTVTVKISPLQTYTDVKLEYYIEDIYSDTEPHTTIPMVSLGNGTFSYVFPGLADNNIVRYRIRATVDSIDQVISPRSNDPYQYYMFFITPAADLHSSRPSYHMFIRSDTWTSLWTNIGSGNIWGIYSDFQNCCVPNPNWNSELPAIVAYQGQAYDVTARYQGSGFNRFNGETIPNFPFNPPAGPSPLLELSWKVVLPKWASVGNKAELYWVKPRDQGCSFVSAYVMYNLFREVGLFAPLVSYAKVYINGGYYSYAMDLNYYSKNLVQDYIDNFYSKNCTNQASEQVGVLFKASGYSGCMGAIGMAGDGYEEPAVCPGKTWTSYEVTDDAYNQETQKGWTNVTNLFHLTDYMSGPNAIDWTVPYSQETITWLTNTFDVNYMLSYLAIMNWNGAWDDMNGNHMMYQRLTDGKWTMGPWDMDNLVGREVPCLNDPTCQNSIFLGEIGAPVGTYQSPGDGNILKDHFIKAFRPEYEERFRLLGATVLSVSNVNKLIDQAMAILNLTELAQSPAGYFDPQCVSYLKNWHQGRHNYVTSTYGNTTSTTLNVCPDKATSPHTITNYVSIPGQVNTPAAIKNDSGVVVKWDVPNNNGAPITSYTLQKSFQGSDFVTIYTGGNRVFIDSGENSTETLLYRVQAANSVGAGFWSLPSTTVILAESMVTTGATYVEVTTTGYPDVSSTSEGITTEYSQGASPSQSSTGISQSGPQATTSVPFATGSHANTSNSRKLQVGVIALSLVLLLIL